MTRHGRPDFDFRAPAMKPAWGVENLHVLRKNKLAPPEPPEPKGATFVASDLLKPKDTGTVRFFHPTAKQALMQSARDAERALREERRRAGDHSMLSERGSRRGSISHDTTEKSLHQTSRSHVGSEMGSVRTARTGKSDHKAPPPAISVEQLRRDLLERERAEAEQRRVEAQARMVVKAQQKREADFQAVQQRLKDEERDFVSKVDQYLSDKDKSHNQKRRALHQNWTECVFNKIQDQLLDRVDTMDPEEISERRRVLFQNYIDAAARKGGGLFLDIVIENEYDPFTWKTHTLRYRNKPALVSNGPGFQDRFGNPVFDPVKKDLEKLKTEAAAAIAVSGGAPPLDGGKLRLGKETLGHEHWSKMEATPFFDRAAKVQDLILAGKGPKVRAATKTNIDLNDYVFPRGPAALDKEIKGLYGGGKKCFLDWQPGGTVFDSQK